MSRYGEEVERVCVEMNQQKALQQVDLQVALQQVGLQVPRFCQLQIENIPPNFMSAEHEPSPQTMQHGNA